MSHRHHNASEQHEGRIQVIGRTYTLIEERKESDDEETEVEDPAEERFEEADQIVWVLSQEGHIGSGQCWAYQGYDRVTNSNSSNSFSLEVSHSEISCNILEHLYSQLRGF